MRTTADKMTRILFAAILALTLTCPALAGCSAEQDTTSDAHEAESSAVVSADDASVDEPEETAPTIDLSSIPEYSGSPYVEIDGNVPDFTDEELDRDAYEEYSPLDDLSRCTMAMAMVGIETMPNEERGSIGEVKPTGWHLVKYDEVDGKYLYNRCHLIGYQLTGENANEKNLITGTRYMNVEGMLPFENEIAEYIEATGNDVLYRVTPVFVGDELVARGVHMEALSLGDAGSGISFNVFCYNVQPGITIDYASGESWRSEQSSSQSNETSVAEYVLNTNTKKFHLPECSSADRISDQNRGQFLGTRDELLAQGYDPCGNCNP